jgi:ion channel-forming bestrophin family protein
VDLYHATRYLPSYALPAGMPSNAELSGGLGSPTSSAFQHPQGATQRKSADARTRASVSGDTKHDLPFPATSPGETGTNTEKAEFVDTPKLPRQSDGNASHVSKIYMVDDDELLPARLPPRYSYLDLFPFSLMLKFLIRRGKPVKGKKATRLRAKLRHQAISHNLPLEISLYLVCFHLGVDVYISLMTYQSSYIAALQERKAVDAATICMRLI